MADNRVRTLLGVALILAAALGAALVVASLMRAPTTEPSTRFPAEANDLPTISVTDAIEVQAKDDRRDVAVFGWFQQTFLHSCPSPMVPLVPVIEGPCALTGWLLGEPESVVHVRRGVNTSELWTSAASGPSIETVFDGPGTAWARPLPERGDAVPTPVVLVGHFDDPHAPDCQPENQQECHDRLVVSAVAWAAGADDP